MTTNMKTPTTLINEAIDKYGDGVDIINITKDKLAHHFSYSYINAHVIKYLISNDFNTYNLNKSMIQILQHKTTLQTK